MHRVTSIVHSTLIDECTEKPRLCTAQPEHASSNLEWSQCSEKNKSDMHRDASIVHMRSLACTPPPSARRSLWRESGPSLHRDTSIVQLGRPELAPSCRDRANEFACMYSASMCTSVALTPKQPLLAPRCLDCAYAASVCSSVAVITKRSASVPLKTSKIRIQNSENFLKKYKLIKCAYKKMSL